MKRTTHRVPAVHPGEILLEDFMKPLGLSQLEVAHALRAPQGKISDIVRARRGISAEMALKLGRYFRTGPEVWMNLQAKFELETARDRIEAELSEIQPCSKTEAA